MSQEAKALGVHHPNPDKVDIWDGRCGFALFKENIAFLYHHNLVKYEFI